MKSPFPFMKVRSLVFWVPTELARRPPSGCLPGRGYIHSVIIHDPAGSDLVQLLEAYQTIDIARAETQEEMLEMASEEAVGGISIPPRFDAALLAGDQPELFAYQNQEAGQGELSIFQRIIEDTVWQLAGADFPATIHWEGIPEPTSAEATGPETQVTFDINQYLFVMLLVMALAMTGGFIVPYLLVEEKEKRTIEALLLSPAGNFDIVAGKAITGLFYSLIIAAIMIVLNNGLQGTWPITIIAIFLGSLLIISIGLILGSAFNSINQVNTWSSIIMLVLMIPSWLVPIGLPDSLSLIFRLIPTHYMSNTITLALAGQPPSSIVLVNLVVLAGATAAAIAIVLWMMNRKARA